MRMPGNGIRTAGSKIDQVALERLARMMYGGVKKVAPYRPAAFCYAPTAYGFHEGQGVGRASSKNT